MEILVLLSSGFGYRGGIAQYCRDFLAALSKSSLVSNVVAIPRKYSPDRDYELPPKIDYNLKAIGSMRRYISEVLRSVKKVDHFDLIICGHINLIPLALLVSEISSTPLWLVIYGTDVWEPNDSLLVNWAVKHIDKYISITDITSERFVDWSSVSPQKKYILPPCYDPNRFDPGPKRQDLVERFGLAAKTVIMTVGRLAPLERYKGFDEVIECLPDLNKKISDLVYLIVGDGEDLARLRAKASSLGASDQVIFAGYVPEKEKADYYRLADAFVMSGYGEGFGIVYLEAMACGVPAVGSKLDGSREALRNGKMGILSDPTDLKSVQNAILQALRCEPGVPEGLDYFSCQTFEKRVACLLEQADL